MSTLDEHTEEEWQELAERPAPAANGAGSVLDVVRARRAELAAEREYDVHVPGYAGLLIVRCRPLPAAMLTRARERMEKSRDPTRDYALAADILIAACDQVLGRRSRGAPWEQLDGSGEAVGLDDRLAELLALGVDPGPQGRARDVVRALFSAAPAPELAVGKAVGEYLAWAQGEDVEVADDLLGES